MHIHLNSCWLTRHNFTPNHATTVTNSKKKIATHVYSLYQDNFLVKKTKTRKGINMQIEYFSI